MRLAGGDGEYLLIERSTFEGSGASADDDLLLNVTVKVGGYSAADQFWIVVSDWFAFLEDLRGFERIRQGETILASPDGLTLVLRAIDHLGHMTVGGTLRWQSQKLEFCFPFDAGMLPSIVRDFEALAH